MFCKISQKFVCVGAENTIFSHVPEKSQTFSDAPAGGGKFARKGVFCWHVGFMVLLFLCCFPHLALNPPCFFVSLFLLFLGVLGCVCVCFSGLVSFVLSVLRMAWFVFFSCENKTNLFILKDVL